MECGSETLGWNQHTGIRDIVFGFAKYSARGSRSFNFANGNMIQVGSRLFQDCTVKYLQGKTCLFNNAVWWAKDFQASESSSPLKSPALKGTVSRHEYFCQNVYVFMIINRYRTFFTIQCCGSVFIFSGSGSGSRVCRWRPIRIRIRIPDPDPIRIQGLNDQKLEKNYSWKKVNFFFIIKNCNLPIPRPP